MAPFVFGIQHLPLKSWDLYTGMGMKFAQSYSHPIWDAISGSQVLPPLRGHQAGIETVLFSPDGSHIISGSQDRNICVWDAQSGVQLSTTSFNHESDLVEIYLADGRVQFNFHPSIGDIQYLRNFMDNQITPISASVNSWIHSLVFTPRQTSVVRTVPLLGHTVEADNFAIRSLAICPDGRRVGSASFDNKLCVWDVDALYSTGSSHRHYYQQDNFRIKTLAFSHDEMRIVSGTSKGSIIVWAAASAALVLGPLRGHQAAVVSVSFSPDDASILSGSEDFTVRVWDAVSGICRFGLQGHQGIIMSAVFSLDGVQIASASNDQSIRIWNAASGNEELALYGHVDRVLAVAFSQNGTQIVSSSWDMTIRIWDVLSGAECLVLQLSGDFASSVAYLPGGETIISDHYSTIREYDASNGKLLSTKRKYKCADIQITQLNSTCMLGVPAYVFLPLIALLLPPSMSVSCGAVSKTSIALSYRGKLCVIHMPRSPNNNLWPGTSQQIQSFLRTGLTYSRTSESFYSILNGT
jgi:WD40 repeat protein